jgi:stage II sporulation protein B
MDKKNPIIIKENGKLMKQNLKQNINSSKRESAATLHESDDDPIKTFESKSVLAEATHKKTSKNSLLKPILIAVISAIIIGAILSVIMFQVLIDVKASYSNQESVNIPTATQSENGKEKTNGDHSDNTAVTLAALHGFVLQGGVFSEQENAETWAKNFSDSGLPAMIWNRGDQYFLLLGLTETKAQAESIVNQLDKNYDLYIKEWETRQGDVSLTKEEQEWLLAFQQKWEENVKQSDNISKDSWAELSKDTKSDRLKSLVDQIEQIESVSGLEGQKYLLNLMFEYEKLMSKTGN